MVEDSAGAGAEGRDSGAEVDDAARQEGEARQPLGEARQPTGESAEEQGAGAGGRLSAEQLGRLREVLVAANPEAVPELIGGETFEALLASVAGARAAFARVREETSRLAASGVPRGGGTREIDPAIFAGLSPHGKIVQGLLRR